MPQYWVVGAMMGGREDHFDIFIRRGYWLLGWADDEQPAQAKRRDQIRPGDFIAIKKIASPDIEIRAIGVVGEIDREDNRVYVRWLTSDLCHRVPSRGCFDSIRGPFVLDDEWTRRVFRPELLGFLETEADWTDVDDASHFSAEGAKRWRYHLVIERSRRNVELKKAQTKQERGSLGCEACGFDFERFYGVIGADFCEVHHKTPLSQLDSPVRIQPDDLALLCSNCHRMIHRTNPMMMVEDFRDVLRPIAVAIGPLCSK